MSDVLLRLFPIYIKAVEFGKTKQHANKKSCGSPISTDIPTVYVICCGGEVWGCHVIHLSSMKSWDWRKLISSIRRTPFRLNLDASMNNRRCWWLWLCPNHFIKPSASLQEDIFPVVCYLGLPTKNSIFYLD